eukprot:COSAG06_NODE_46709_length_344_cov_1.889796_1_plen_25_part_01
MGWELPRAQQQKALQHMRVNFSRPF